MSSSPPQRRKPSSMLKPRAPSSRRCKRYRKARQRSGPPPPRSSTIEALRQLAATGGSAGQADAICLAWLGLTEAAKQPRIPDPSIVDSRALIGTRLDQPMRLSALAAALNISPIWLSHHFTEQIGMPLRRYVVAVVASSGVGADGSYINRGRVYGRLQRFDPSVTHLPGHFRCCAPSFLFGRWDQVFVCFANGRYIF